jgi:GMP synthase-like glutamine amidotransferase
VRALFIQQDHVSPVGPVGERLAERGYDIVEFNVVPGHRFDSPNVVVDFPDPLDYDVIIPMGAAWSVFDHTTIGNWILDELALLRTAHEAGVPILGICFGGQALAAALGGSVRRAPAAEVGWYVIETDDSDVVGQGPWFQWHHDQFVPPPGAVEIARTPVGPQAFALGRSLGLQFHPELTSETLQAWLDNGGESYMVEHGIDSAQMMRETKVGDSAATERTHVLVDRFLDRIANRDLL